MREIKFRARWRADLEIVTVAALKSSATSMRIPNYWRKRE
jgi:hypothetical protein